MCWAGMEWISMAYNRRKWRAFVDIVMKFGGSVKSGKFLDELRNCQLPMEDSAPWNWSAGWLG